MSKYATLVDFFVAAIEHGSYCPGDALPSLRSLCQAHGVGMNTAKRAYYELERQGYVEALPRAGFRVAAGGGATASAKVDTVLPWGSPFINPALFDGRALAQAFVRVQRRYPELLARHELLGLDVLRRQLARQCHAEGMALDWDQIVITCGGMEALALAVQVVTHEVPAPCLAVLTPAFPGLLGLMAQHGIATLALPVGLDGALDLTPLAQGLAYGRVHGIAVMANFQHPTGHCLSEAARAALWQLAERYDVPIIEDDAYHQLAFEAPAPAPLKARDSAGRVLYCATFSKSLAPGYRVGWIAPGRYLDAVCRLKVSTTLASPLPNQMAIAELLADGGYQPGLRRLNQQLAERAAVLRRELAARLPASVRLSSPQGGYFLWLEQDDGPDSQTLLAEAQAHGLHFAPGALFYPGGVGQRHALRLNLSYVEPAGQLAALDWLAAALGATPAR